MIDTLVYVIALPAILAGAIWGIAWRVWNRESKPVLSGTWAGAIAVGIGMVVAYIGLTHGVPGYPPKVAEGWLPYVAVGIFLVGLLDNALLGPKPLRWILWSLVIVATALILTTRLRTSWSGSEQLIYLLLATAAFSICIQLTEALALRNPGASLPLALWVWTAGIAAALGASGSITYGQFGGALAAAMGAGIVVSWLKPTFSFSRGALATVMALAGGLLLCGYYFSELPLSSAILFALAPPTMWLGELPVIKRQRPWAGVLLRATFIAVPVAIALLFAVWPVLFPKPGTGSEYY